MLLQFFIVLPTNAAGILGEGQDDQMVCFYCSQGLKYWEDDDDPWVEHAKWSPNCFYLLLNKGKQFVDASRSIMKSEEARTHLTAFQMNILTIRTYFAIYLQEWLKLFADHKDTSSVPEDSTNDAAKTYVNFVWCVNWLNC